MASRVWRGMTSAANLPALLLGGWACRGFDDYAAQERLERGLVILLPGIEGRSVLETNVARGLIDGGVQAAIEVQDWTSGWWVLMPWHLCAYDRNRRMAARIASRIEEYRSSFPGRPVHLIGHSGGAGMALFVLEALPDDVRVSSVILLAAAVSSGYSLSAALEHTDEGIWNFHSVLDGMLLGLASLVAGTMDRRRAVAAGALGFDTEFMSQAQQLSAGRLHQVPFTGRMCLSGNLGGHFGCMNRLFAEEWLAPIVTRGALPSA